MQTMQYSPPNQMEMDPAKPPSYPDHNTTAPQIQPVAERGPRMVVPLDQVRDTPVDVDCPYCEKVVRTEVRKVDAGDTGMMQCLICLVCWPMLFCYEGDKDTNHHCSVPTCGRQLTHQPHGGRAQAVAVAQGQARQVASKYEQA